MNADLEIGGQLLNALDGAKVKGNVALWIYSAEHEDWRLVLASHQLDSLELREAYRLVHDSMEKSGFDVEQTPPLMILRMNDRLFASCGGCSAKLQASKVCVSEGR